MARTELGALLVQGLDYAYTLQGWIKGLNSSFLDPTRDMGRDGAGGTTNVVSRDVFSYTLGFYRNGGLVDYTPINSAYAIEPTYDLGSSFNSFALPMYNGNIRYIMQQNQSTSSGAYIHGYNYDQAMRLKQMNTYVPSNPWVIGLSSNTAPLAANFKELGIIYDRNGNIKNYQRWGSDGTQVMDNLTYTYQPNTNKLSHVDDAVTNNTLFAGDVDDQAANNYTYDASGNLIADAQGGSTITWSPYGKVLEVYSSAFASTTTFGYDAQQNRTHKRQTSLSSDISTYYIRDAQGNVMAVYEKNGSTVTWKEQHLYGSSRLGTVEPGVSWTSTPPTTPNFRTNKVLNVGWHRYEVTDHLGNVRSIINDRRSIVNPGNSSTQYYTATILHGNDYFPFGAEMRGSIVSGSKYRYGFNGKELDKNGEFGSLNHYDYGFRIYNPGIGRFLSVDPLTQKYPELTPYQFASNTPIWAIDLDGLEAYFTNMGVFSHFGKDKSLTAPVILITDSKEIKIQLNYTELLDRSHWVFGEGRGNFADYYAHTIQNGKEWGYHGEGFTESKTYTVFMQDKERKGKADFFSGHSGVSSYDDFAEARSNPSELNKLRGASTSIRAVLYEQAGLTYDPTFGATNWAGDGAKSNDSENYAIGKVGTDLVLALTSKDGRTHIFYDLRNKKDLDRLGISRPSRKTVPIFKIDSNYIRMPQFDKLPNRPIAPLDYLKELRKKPRA